MGLKTIQHLMDELSLEFVLCDASEPDSLSAVLPILEKLEKEARTFSNTSFEQQVSRAMAIIREEAQKGDTNPFDALDQALADMSEGLSGETGSEPALPQETDVPDGSGEKGEFSRLQGHVDALSASVGSFCPGPATDGDDISAILDRIESESRARGGHTLSTVATACSHYLDTVSLDSRQALTPIEEALPLMKALVRHLKRGIEFTFETEDILALLDVSGADEPVTDVPESGPLPEPAPQTADLPPSAEPDGRETQLSQDDLEILADFVSEAADNLDAIEVHLVELEQDPMDMDIINTIFRSIHTIKGVSGFLSLQKINGLSHATETLLDSARSREFVIDQSATDAILAAVDMLKKLVDRVRDGLEKGIQAVDDDLHVATLEKELHSLRVALTRGDKEPIGEILVRKGVVDRETMDQTLDIQQSAPGKPIGEILVETDKASPKEIASALMDQKTPRKKIANQVKVNTEKLDNLVDFAGELVIAQSMLKQQAAGKPSLLQSIVQLGQIVTHMQTIAMSMRMIPIKATFMKMIRLVRDLAKKSGKDVTLTMAGEDTEIDRNVVDALYEPMVHMIRNAVDHGIEPGPERLEKGKPDQGRIHLNAFHKGGHILIEIQDDGKGLDKDRIRSKALERGLISESDTHTDTQLFELIMAPGFSTASQITDVSGRGVGMDVVKNGIEKFRGHLAIDSQKDKGTRFTISLPLTLAIIDGMLVRVETETYVIPTTAIQRVFKPDESDCFTVEQKGEMIKDRDQLLPLVRLSRLFEAEADPRPAWESLAVVVESKAEQRALLIDELLGKDEYVIKSLGGGLDGTRGFAGGAILGDGQVGLILDIHAIFDMVSPQK